MEYLKIPDLLPKGWDKDAHYHLFYSNLYLDEVIRIWLQKLKISKYFKELIFNTLLFSYDQFIISDTEENLQKAFYLLYKISKEYNLEISAKETKYLVSLERIT